MEGQQPKQTNNLFYLSQGIKFKSNQSEKTDFKLFRRRSVTSLNKKDLTPSPNTKNFKQKHLMYKKDLLQERFQNLQVNNFQKQEKKPLKLKLQRLNKENNLIVMRQLTDISNEIEIKFQAQNCLIRKSLDRMERIASKNLPHQTFQRIDGIKNKKSELKFTENALNENEKNLKLQMESLAEQKRKLEDEIKSVKAINNFLTSQNYKLSMENQMLKSKIIEYEQTDYDNALKTQFEIESEENSLKETKINQQQTNRNFQKIQSNQSLNIENQLSKRSSHQDVLIKQIHTQNFSLESKQLEQDNKKSPFKLTNQDINQFNGNLQNCQIFSKQLQTFSNRINQLEQELYEQKNINDELSNKIAVLKLYHDASNSQNKERKHEESFESAISIKMDLNSKEQSKQEQSIQNYNSNFQFIKQSTKNSQSSLANIQHKVTKSKILSNQIIYFAEVIPSQHEKSLKSKNSIKSKKALKSSQTKEIQDQEIQPLDTINEQDEDQKRKTMCMKSLQIPVQEIKKRRKSISQKLNFCLQKKEKSLNLNNSLSFYSNQKVNLLQMIRQTISLKFEAFKYTFELFQNQMILWPNRKATFKELKSILSQYPFFLDEGTIELLFGYCNIEEGRDMRVDLFCNKMREFIGEYEELSEEEELILEKKIYKRWKYTQQQILENMKRNEIGSGQITKNRFISVFQEFKYEDKQIHYLLSQSVALSSDINHIKYRQYLDNFLAKE